MFPLAPLVVIPSADLIFKVEPLFKVKEPPPVITVPVVAIVNIFEAFTVKSTVFETVPPEV